MKKILFSITITSFGFISNAQKLILAAAIATLFLTSKAQTVTDADGNTYDTVTIGTQTWLKENLKTTKYNDGVAIPNVTDNAAWAALSTPAYCWYNNNAATYKATYGAMYNWHTVNSGKICPTGWHVPSIDEVTILYTFLGGISIAGNKLKEQGTNHWNESTSATNSSGFTGLPGGERWVSDFVNIGNVGAWWSTVEDNTINAKEFNLAANEKYVSIYSFEKRNGFNIRCLKDTNSTEQITVTFNVDGGSVIPILVANRNTIITKPADPTKNGYSFAGWYKEAAFTNVWNFATTVVTANITLYAKWEKTSTSVEVNQFNSFGIYPNPATTILTLSNLPQNASIEILGLDGRLAKQIKPTGIETTLDIANLPKGVYMIRLNSSQGTMVHKFVKE